MKTNSQLIKKAKETGNYQNIYPIAYIDGIIDKESNEKLSDILIRYNHILVPWQGSVTATRNRVTLLMRRQGLWITYVNDNSEITTEVYKGSAQDIISNWADDVNWEIVPDVEYVQNNASKIPDGAILPQHLSKELQELLLSSGKVVNLPDGEDLTTQGIALKFKDREYNPEQASGKGYKILRKNWTIVNNRNINLLTQEMISDSNTVYEIRYDFDLNGQEIVIPENCVLQFEGGSFNNGTLNFNDSIIKNLNTNFINCLVSGNIKNEKLKLEWFSKENISYYLQFLIGISDSRTIYISSGVYYLENTINIYSDITIIGDNSGEKDGGTIGTIITSNEGLSALFSSENNSKNYNIRIENISFNGNKLVNSAILLNSDRSGVVSNIFLFNCTFLGFNGIALYYKYGWIGTIEKCNFWDNNQACFLQDAVNSTRIIRTVVSRNKYGIVIAEGNSITISECTIEQNKCFGIFLGMGRGVVISNNYFENNCLDGFLYKEYNIKSDIILSNSPLYNSDNFSSIPKLENYNDCISENIDICNNWVLKDSDSDRSFIYFSGGSQIRIHGNSSCDYSYAGLKKHSMYLLEYIMSNSFLRFNKVLIDSNIGFNEDFKCLANIQTVFVQNSTVVEEATNNRNLICKDGSNIQFTGIVAGNFVKDYSVNKKLTIKYDNPNNDKNIGSTINTKDIIIKTENIKTKILLVSFLIKFENNLVVYVKSVTSPNNSYEDRIVTYNTPNEWMRINILLYWDNLEEFSFNIRNIGDKQGSLLGLQLSDIYIGDFTEFGTEEYLYISEESDKNIGGITFSKLGEADKIYDGIYLRNYDGTLTSKVNII